MTEFVTADDLVVKIVDPGYVKGTESVSKMPKLAALAAKSFAAATGRTVEVGASTYVDAVAVKGKESYRCFITSWRIHPFVPFLYTPEGKEQMERLWTETMKELGSANSRALLTGRHDSGGR